MTGVMAGSSFEPEVESVAEGTATGFRVECKRRIRREADGGSVPGELGALPRRRDDPHASERPSSVRETGGTSKNLRSNHTSSISATRPPRSRGILDPCATALGHGLEAVLKPEPGADEQHK